MPAQRYPCPRCKQPEALEVRVSWLVADDERRRLDGVEVHCRCCGFGKSLRVYDLEGRR